MGGISMQKQVIIAILIAGVVITFAGYKAQVQKPQLPAGHSGLEGGMQPTDISGMPKVEHTVIVSKEVQAKWKAVKILIEDKADKTSKEYTVNVGSDLAVPNTSISIKVFAFIPHFSMSDKEITSKSNEPKMPAAQVLIQEPGKPEWKGWLFSTVPDLHPLEHETLGVKLAGGVAT
jgi:hypothetical protein